MGVAVPIAAGFINGAISGIAGGPTGMLVGALIGAVMGAAIGFANKALADKGNGSGSRKIEDIVHSTAIRNLPVPVVFGRARMGGNYIQLGKFFMMKDRKENTPGRRLYQLHAILGVCEGKVRQIWNFYVDGVRASEAADREEFVYPSSGYNIKAFLGGPAERIPSPLYAVTTEGDVIGTHAYDQAKLLPWRNTAKIALALQAGDQPRLVDINCDVIGPNFRIRKAGSTTESNPHDVLRYCWYDAHTECFYGVLSSSDTESPLGVVRVPRMGGERSHQPPPYTIQDPLQKAWYLGRHDILVMQDPGDSAMFHIGYWGIASNSSDWERVRPHPDYQSAILAHHLDELNGTLHTLHGGSSNLFILRWNLLSGRITRVDLQRANQTITGFMFSPDLNAYVLALPTGNKLVLVDGETGQKLHAASKVDLSACKGLCVSGQRIGVITQSGCVYYNPYASDVSERLGSSTSANLKKGGFGAITNAVQNTWTGQVSMSRPYSSSAGYINFIPSYFDPPKKNESDPDPVVAWIRDWNWRAYNKWSYVGLEGEHGSVAAAMWNLIVDEPRVDSGRWGCGLKNMWASLPSFESVHAYCVGSVKYRKPNGRSYYTERYRFDMAVDSEVSASQLLSSEMLVAINGFRYVRDGKLHVGVQRPALPIVWHFTDHQISDGKITLSFLGRNNGVNKVRVDFVNIDDDYRHDHGEASNEFDQNARGRVMSQSVSAMGVGRQGHADLLAASMLDVIGGVRRQVQFTTSFSGLVLTPGDGIEVSSTAVGLDRVKFRIASIEEDEKGSIQITAVEHLVFFDRLHHTSEDIEVEDPTGCAALAKSAEARIPLPAMPIHAAVYEYSNQPMIVPLAGMPINSVWTGSINVYRKMALDANWTKMGSLPSSIGGYLMNDISTSATVLPFGALHGAPDSSISVSLPVIIARHEEIGNPQEPRPTTGDEVAMATSVDFENQAYFVDRASPQSWSKVTRSIAAAYTVGNITDECGPAAVTYRQARNVQTDALADVWLPSSDISYYPFYITMDGVCYVFKSTDAASLNHGTIATNYSVSNQDDLLCSIATPSECNLASQPEEITINAADIAVIHYTNAALCQACDNPAWTCNQWSGNNPVLTLDPSPDANTFPGCYRWGTGNGWNTDPGNLRTLGDRLMYNSYVTLEGGVWVLQITCAGSYTGIPQLVWKGVKTTGSTPLGTYTFTAVLGMIADGPATMRVE